MPATDLVGRLRSEAQTILDRHQKRTYPHCTVCLKKWPCPDYEAAVRVLGIATELAERDEKIDDLLDDARSGIGDSTFGGTRFACRAVDQIRALLLAERYPEEGAS